MGQLADEVIEAQKARSDLLKWKVVLVAALSAVGFGFASKTPRAEYNDLALCCIPLVCAYVDMLCRHLSLRISVIGHYRKARGAETDKGQDEGYYKGYEALVETCENKGVFSLERFVVVASSVVFCALVACLPYGLRYIGDTPRLPHGDIVAAGGLVGVALAFMVQMAYKFLDERVKGAEVPKVESSEATRGQTHNQPPGD
jgi:hypothetical protein